MQYVIEMLALAAIFALEQRFPFAEQTRTEHHVAKNLSIYAINLIMIYVVLGIALAEAKWVDLRPFGLLAIMHLPAWAGMVAAIVLIDISMYAMHRLNHTVPLLWRFHRLHHSDTQVDASTALRAHPGEQLFSLVILLTIIPLIGVSPFQLTVYIFCSRFVVFFHHSNIALPEKWDRVIRSVIVSPNMHRVHHLPVLPETDSNYSNFFSFWDRLFGTFRLRTHDCNTIRYGLDEFSGAQWQTLAGMLKTPFARRT